MRTLLNLAILLLTAFVATAEQPTFGVVSSVPSVFGIARGGGLFGGKDKAAGDK